MAASRRGTISMMPSAGVVVVSTMPNTHCSERGGRPRWCCEYQNIKSCTELSMLIVYLGLVRFIYLDNHALASKKQWRVDIHEPPTTYVTEILVALYGSHLRDLRFLCSTSYWVFPNPPVNEDYPLLQRKLRLLEEATRSDAATLLASIIWTSPPDVE